MMHARPPRFALASALALAALATAAVAGDKHARGRSSEYRAAIAVIEGLAKAKPASKSTGTYTKGGVENAAELPAKGFGYKLADAKRKTNFGSDAMVFGLIELAAVIAERHPGTPWLSVGDISKQGGGKLDPHINHQDGCDCDLAYLYCTPEGQPCDRAWLACNAEGKTKQPAAVFDVARNFEMLSLMVDSPYFGKFAWIFVYDPIKKLLVEHGRELAKKNPRSAADLERITNELEKLLRQPKSSPHDDHFHLRVGKGAPGGE